MRKKCLDIACRESPHFLLSAMENPENLYVGLDISPEPYSPRNFYWKSKESALKHALYENGIRDKEDSIWDMVNELVVASWLIDVDTEEHEKFIELMGYDKSPEYFEIDKRLEELRKESRGKNILETAVGDILYDDKKVISVFYDTFPEIIGEPVDEKGITHSGFYAWCRLRKILFGKYSDCSMEDILKMLLPSDANESLQKAISRIKFVSGDMYNLPFKDKTFDYVRGSGTGDLIEDKAISEAQRVLKKGKIVKIGYSGIDTDI